MRRLLSRPRSNRAFGTNARLVQVAQLCYKVDIATFCFMLGAS